MNSHKVLQHKMEQRGYSDLQEYPDHLCKTRTIFRAYTQRRVFSLLLFSERSLFLETIPSTGSEMEFPHVK
jgi:hypothetical protein